MTMLGLSGAKTTLNLFHPFSADKNTTLILKNLISQSCDKEHQLQISNIHPEAPDN